MRFTARKVRVKPTNALEPELHNRKIGVSTGALSESSVRHDDIQ
jgi:hypothetical protein